MKNEALIEFAEKLKKAREKKRISLQQIKAQTRISIEYLEAIEKADFDVMPPVYMRAFIKEYAETIGLNGAEILAEYDAIKTGKKPPEATETETVKREEETVPPTFTDEPGTHSSAPSPSGSPQWIVPASVVALIVVAAAIIYLAFFRSSDEILVEEKPYSEIVKENQSRFEEPTPPSQSVTPRAVPAVDSVRLKLIATDSCWVKVNFDGDSLKTTDFIMFKGHVKTLKAERIFKLVLGNSGGIKILLNDDTLRFNGAKGKVKTLIINKNGIVNRFK